MRALIFLLLFLLSAFGELDLNSKARTFSIELLHHAVQDSNYNIIISPYVIWYLLISMAYESLEVTREQYAKVFSLTEDRSEVVKELVKQRTLLQANEGVTIEFFNFIFYDEDLNLYSGSIKRLEDDFRFETWPLPFEEPPDVWQLNTLRSYLNVSAQILISPLHFENATMIMYSYFSFDAEWSKPFNVSDTVHEYNRYSSPEGEYALYMKARLRFSDLESLHASFTELPYRGDRYCMLLLRPHKGYDVKQVLGNLREISLKDVFAKLQSDVDEFGLREVEVKLPMIVNVTRNLNKPLFNMGLSDMFDENSANFNSFTSDSIYVGEISQSVSLIMTESGTTVLSVTPSHTNRYVFPVERSGVKDPFIFFIMEKPTATILLGGIYSKIVEYVRIPTWWSQ